MENNTNKKLSFSIAGYDLPERQAGKSLIDGLSLEQGSKTYVPYGADNLFPQFLYGQYSQCSILGGLINGIADMIFNEMKEEIDLTSLSEDTLLKAVYDYLIFGGFSLEVLRGRTLKISQVKHIPFEYIRVNQDLTTAFYNKRWGKYTQKYESLPINDAKATHSIYYFNGRLTRGTYPVPMYISALKSVEIQNEIKTFHLATIKNNFNSNLVMNINQGNYTDETKKKIEKLINEKFSGAENAGKMIIMFNDSKDYACSIERLQSDNFDDKYQALDKSTKDDIFIAFRATPCLFGMAPENNGFSKEEYQEAMALFNRNVITPIKDSMMGFLKKYSLI